MDKVRPDVEVLLRDRIGYEGCDEGASGNFARCRLFQLKRKDRNVPSLHLSWRQQTTISNLTTEEIRLLTTSGFDIKAGGASLYVSVLEKKFRHRHLVFAQGGWCISTLPYGQNIDSLAACPHTIIPTIALDKTAEMVVGLHDAFRTLKEELKLHGILNEYFTQQEKIFGILAVLEKDAGQEIQEATSVPMGRVLLSSAPQVSIAKAEQY